MSIINRIVSEAVMRGPEAYNNHASRMHQLMKWEVCTYWSYINHITSLTKQNNSICFLQLPVKWSHAPVLGLNPKRDTTHIWYTQIYTTISIYPIAFFITPLLKSKLHSCKGHITLPTFASAFLASSAWFGSWWVCSSSFAFSFHLFPLGVAMPWVVASVPYQFLKFRVFWSTVLRFCDLIALRFWHAVTVNMCQHTNI